MLANAVDCTLVYFIHILTLSSLVDFVFSFSFSRATWLFLYLVVQLVFVNSSLKYIGGFRFFNKLHLTFTFFSRQVKFGEVLTKEIIACCLETAIEFEDRLSRFGLLCNGLNSFLLLRKVVWFRSLWFVLTMIFN